LQNTCFSLLTFRYQTKQSTLDTLLLIGTDDGVFEIKQGKATKIINYKNVRKLFQPSHPSNQLMFGVKDGFFIYEYQNGKWIEKRHFTEINHDVFQIEQDLDSSIWLNGPYEVYNLKQEAQNWGNEIKKYGAENGLSVARRPYIYQLQSMGNKKGTCIYFATEEGLFFFDKSKQKFSLQKINDKNLKNIWEVREDNESNLWIRTYVNGKSHIHIIFKNQEQSIFDTVSFNRLPEISVYTIFPDNQYIVWFGGSNGLLRFYPSVVNSREYNFNVLIRNVEFNNSIKLGDISSLSGDYKKITIPFESNNVLFRYVAPFFIEEEKTLYSYFLEGEDEKWSDWQSKNEKEYTNLQEGNYVFHVKAKNLYEVESSITTFSFTISPPWYRTWWSYILYTVLSLTFIVIIVKLNSIRLIRKNEKLEQIIQERTLKVVLQKKEIEIQKGEIEIQKGEITDSINYASRIQTAILPFKEVLEKISSDFFVLWKPRDIVSGDFYWFKQIDNYTLIAAVDCTGHGVPGAFMSMLGTAFLNEIATNIEIKIRYQLENNFEISAADILNQLREKVKQSLHQTGKDGEAKDGMDIALCIIDKTNNQLNFAGAHNPLYITREKNLPSIEGNKVVKAEFENCYLYQIKADSMPIGIFIKEQKFTDQYLKILTTDELFIFSDGFMDQIGGISNERFKSKRLKELFAKIRNKPMKEQKEFIEETFNDWVMYEKVLNQMDDILVIGIKI